MNQRVQYVCPKCGCQQYEHDQFQATGGNFAKDIRRAEQKIRHDFLRKLRVYGALQSAEFFRVGYPGFSDRRISASVERRLPPFKNKGGGMF